jgi:hypothetical protein
MIVPATIFPVLEDVVGLGAAGVSLTCNSGCSTVSVSSITDLAEIRVDVGVLAGETGVITTFLFPASADR